MKKFTIISLVILCMMISIVYSMPYQIDNKGRPFIEADGYKIIASKETYYCENVISPDGCLINADLEIHNNNPFPKDINLEFNSNKGVSFREHAYNRKSIASVIKSGNRDLKGVGTNKIFGNTIVPVNVQFYVKESGKFNYTITYDGVELILDPFYNISYNVSNPSLYLIDGNVSTADDSTFASFVNITTELGDFNDGTNYDVFINLSLGSKITYEEHDSLPDGQTADINTAGEGYFTNISFTSKTNLQNVELCFLTQSVDGTPVPNVSIALNHTNGEYPIVMNAFDSPLVADTWVCSNISETYFSYFETYDNLMFGLACVNCDGANKFKIRRDDEGITGIFDVDDIVSPSWGVDLGRTLMMNVTFTTATSEFSNSDALRLTYPISFNTNNDYWIKVRKITGAITTAFVYLYDDGVDSLNSFLTFHPITTGDDIIPLNISQNITASLRLFTTSHSNISEAILIEGINDTIPPVINDFNINITSLSCNDTIRLQSNITDDNMIDDVFFHYTDNTSKIVQANKIIDTDTYYIDITYSHDSNNVKEIYNWTFINSTDIVGHSTTINPSLQYNYTCDATPLDIIPPNISDITFSPDPVINNGSEETPVIINFTSSEFPINLTFNLYNSSGELSDTEGIFIINSSANLPITYTVPLGLAEDIYTLNMSTVDNGENLVIDFIALINVSFPIVDVSIPSVVVNITNSTNFNILTDDLLYQQNFSDDISLFSLVLTLFDSTGSQLFQNTTLLGNVTFYQTIEKIVLSTYGQGNFTLLFNVSDLSGNSALEYKEYKVTNFSTFLTLITPLNNSVVELNKLNSEVNFVHISGGDTDNCTLFFNNSIIIVEENENQGLHDLVIDFYDEGLLENATYEWYISCHIVGDGEVASEKRLLNVVDTSITELFSIGSCPNTTPNVMMLGLLLFFALTLILIGFIFGMGFVGFFGSLILMVLSWFIVGCFGILGFITALFSLVLLIWFVFSGLGFNNRVFQ